MADTPNQDPRDSSGPDQPAQRLTPDEFKRTDLRSQQIDSNLLLQGEQQKPEEKVEQSFEKDLDSLPAGSPKRIIFFGFLIMLGLASLLAYLNSRRAPSEPLDTETIIIEHQQEIAAKEDKETISSPIDAEIVSEQIKKLVARYCSAKTIDERIKYCRQTPDLREKMERYHESNPFVTVEVKEKHVIVGSARIASGITFFVVKVLVGEDRSIVLPACETNQGYRIDWEASAIYQDKSWSDLIKAREPTKMRVFADVDNFFIQDFTTKTHLCLSIEAPGLTFPCYAYIDRSSKAYEDLGPVLARWRAGKYGHVEVIFNLSHVHSLNTTQFFTVEDTIALSWIDPYE